MVYVFDGYNIIYSLGFIDRADGNMQRARELFVGFVEAYLLKSKKNIQAVIVFDSFRNNDLPNIISKSGKFKVVFAKCASADSWIRAFVRTSKRKGDLTIVSEDRKDVMGFARSAGCAVMTGKEIKKRFSKLLGSGGSAGKAGDGLNKNTQDIITRELHARYIDSKNNL